MAPFRNTVLSERLFVAGIHHDIDGLLAIRSIFNDPHGVPGLESRRDHDALVFGRQIVTSFRSPGNIDYELSTSGVFFHMPSSALCSLSRAFGL